MLRHARTPVVLLFAIAISIALGAQTPVRHHAKHKAVKVVAPPPQPAVVQAAEPEPPKFPVDLPAVAPKVAYYNGMLSIDAPNSNLSDVLKEIKRLTGATVEGDNVSDRIVAHLGPGNPSAIITDLLSGSRFDYIILGSLRDPNVLLRLVLMPRAGGPPPVGPTPQAAVVQVPPRAGGAPAPAVANTEAAEEAEDPTQQPEAQQEEESPAGGLITPQDMAQPDPNAPQQVPGGILPGTGQPQVSPDQQQPKTPEQIYLEQLQKRQLPQPNQPPVPQP